MVVSVWVSLIRNAYILDFIDTNMDFDFLITVSWSENDIKTKKLWAEELSDRGYDVCVITVTDGIKESFEEVTLRSYNVRQYPSEDHLSPRYLEETYEIPSIENLYLTEKQYLNLTNHQSLQKTLGTAEKLEGIFNNHSFKYALHNNGGEIHRLLSFYFIENQGGTNIWDVFSPFPKTKAFSTHFDCSWDNYETIPYKNIPSNEIDNIQDYIDKFKERKGVFVPPSDIDDNKIVNKILAKIKSLVLKESEADYHRLAMAKTRRNSFERINKMLVPSIDESHRLCEEEKYLYYPMQYSSESRLTRISPQFYDQQFVISYLSRILPSNLKLFIKQHPHHSGQESPKQIHQNKNDSGIKYLHPKMNSHDVIDSAAGVVVINNTVGFESLLYETPTIVLGNSFYNQTPAAINIDDLADLPLKIAALDQQSTTIEDQVSSIFSLRKASFPSVHQSLNKKQGIINERVTTVIDRLLSFCDSI